MFLVLRPVRLLMRALLSASSPQQLAWGFSLGMLIGIVPKGNLLAVLLGIVAASFRVNLGIVAMAAVVFSLCSPMMDPACDWLGSALLGQPALQSLWTELANTPVVPWTNFYNSIVLGSFVLGLLLLWPMQRLTLPLFELYADVIAENARRWRLTRVLLGAEWANRIGSVE